MPRVSLPYEPGLAAVARRPARVPAFAVEDLVGVVAGERHLRRAHEVQVVVRQVVDLARVRAEEAGARHDLRPHQRGRDHEREPVGRGLRRRHVEQRDLELRADALEEVEARAADLRAAFHVDRAELRAQVEVVLRLEVEHARLTDGLDDHEVVLAADRRVRVHQVRDPAQELLDLVVGGVLLGLGGLDLGGQVLRLDQQGGRARRPWPCRPPCRALSARRAGCPRGRWRTAGARPRTAGCRRRPRPRHERAATRALSPGSRATP